MREFYIDSNRYEELIQIQKNKNPKYLRMHKVTYIFIILALIVLVVTEYYGYSIMNTKEILSDCFIIGIGIDMVIMVIWSGYYVMIKQICEDLVKYKLNERLILEDEFIQNEYKPDSGTINCYDEYKVRYDEIDKIILNEYYQTVELYGKIQKVRYVDDNKGEVIGNYKKENDCLKLYLYYYENEKFLELIKEKSTVKIEVINYKKSTLRRHIWTDI